MKFILELRWSSHGTGKINIPSYSVSSAQAEVSIRITTMIIKSFKVAEYSPQVQ